MVLSIETWGGAVKVRPEQFITEAVRGI